jgi:hypothetical protein
VKRGSSRSTTTAVGKPDKEKQTKRTRALSSSLLDCSNHLTCPKELVLTNVLMLFYSTGQSLEAYLYVCFFVI